MTTDFDPLRLLLDNTRRDARVPPNASPGAYVLPGGQQRAVQGDEDAPWAKVVPFPTELIALGNPHTLPTTHTALAAASPVIDVRDFRYLTLYVTYSPGAQNCILSMIPFGDGYPFGFADPTATALVPPGYSQNFSSRNIRPLELRYPATVVGANNPLSFQYTFDVGPHVEFALSTCEATNTLTSTIALHYTLNT